MFAHAKFANISRNLQILSRQDTFSASSSSWGGSVAITAAGIHTPTSLSIDGPVADKACTNAMASIIAHNHLELNVTGELYMRGDSFVTSPGPQFFL